MKALPIIFLAALAAFVLLPISFEIAMSFLCVAGLASLLFADYAQRPSRVRCRVRPAMSGRESILRLAA